MGDVPFAAGNASFVDRDMPFAAGNATFVDRDVFFADGNAAARTFGRAHRHRPYQPPSNTSTTQSSLILCIGKLFASNFMTQTI